MAITVQDNIFTSTTTSEPASSFVAGTVSFTGLVPIFGTTGAGSETEIGIMTIPNMNNWFSRLYSSPQGLCGPTGAWANEWWSIYNYLQYGGICVVGGTGSTGDYYSPTGVLTATNTPLHNKNLISLDAIFDTGITASVQAAISVATSRQDCIAVVGNYKKITGVPGLNSNYNAQATDFGYATDSPYVAYVAGRKKFVAGVGTTVNILESNLSSDVAGCMSRSLRDNKIWYSPAGKTRGRILGVVSLQQNFSETDSAYIYGGNVNPVMSIAGQGTYLMGNKTTYSSTTSPLNRINISVMILYLKKQLLSIAQNYLFEMNDATLRQRMISSSVPVLEEIKAGNGITDYRIVCDETNNTDAVISSGQLVVTVYVKPQYVAETVQITIVNSTTSEAFIA